MDKKEYEKYMDLALEEAKKAFINNDVPVGAILLNENNEIVTKTHNKKEKKNDISAHAEILAIKEAETKKGDWRLENYTLVVTLSPCLMCLGAIIASRIKKVVIGCEDDKRNEKELSIINDLYFDNKIEVIRNIKEKECKEILKEFFNKKR